MGVERFRVAEIPSAGFLNRLRGRIPREVVFAKLRNLLATTPFHEIAPSDVDNLLREGNLARGEVHDELSALFEQAVQIFAADKRFSDNDRAALLALQTAFALSDNDVSGATDRAGGAVYETALREALADGIFTDGERNRLEELVTQLRLSSSMQQQVFASVVRGALQTEYSAVLEDGRVTAEEDQHLTALAAALGVSFHLGPETQLALDRGRRLARIEGGDMPILDVPIFLAKGEQCHFLARGVSQHEMRVVTKRVNYSGPVASLKIVRGVRWRIGSVSVQRVTKDVLTKIDDGDFYVTNKKIFFQGLRKNTSIALGKIVHFQIYSDGIQIDKQSGKDMYVNGPGEWEVAGACIEAALRGLK